MDDDLHWRIAVHESGHAVCARLLGLPSGGASIEPDAYAEFARDCGAASICALMAGAVAEGVVLGGYDSVGLKEDWRRASERLRRLGSTTVARCCVVRQGFETPGCACSGGQG